MTRMEVTREVVKSCSCERQTELTLVPPDDNLMVEPNFLCSYGCYYYSFYSQGSQPADGEISVLPR